jgi:hypothetical protein
MKTKRIVVHLPALALIVCALSYPVLAQNVQTTDPRITTETGDRVCVAAQMSGADIGAKINACDAALGSAKGEIWLTGGGNIATQVVISPNHTLRVMSGTYPATTTGAVIRLKDNSSLVCDSWGPTLQESTGSVGVNSPFTIVTPYNGASSDSPNGALAQNIVIRGCHLKGARSDFHSAPQTIGLGNCKNCQATNNWLENTRTIGIQAGGGSMNGFYAQNVLISGNLLTGVASQNIAVTNAEGVIVSNNTMRAPGQSGGPGVSVIDVEPNVGDRTKNVKITGNMIDATNGPIGQTTNGIVVQNGNGANPFGHIEVTNNTVIAADHSNNLGNNILFANILVRTASDVRVADNFLRRANRGIVVDFGSTGVIVERNTCATCGTPSSFSMSVDDSAQNNIFNNVLYNQSGDALAYPDGLVRNIVETGLSNNNTYAGNYAVTSLAGAGSRVIYEHVGKTSFDFRLPAGVAPFTVSLNSAKVANLDADKLDGQDGSFYQNAFNLNAGIVAPARLGTGSANSSTFLRGDGTWAAVGSGSGNSGWTAAGTVVRLTTSTDSVGIGTSSPVAKLDVSNASAGNMLHLGAGPLPGTLFSTGNTINNESASALYVYRAGQFFLRQYVTNFGHVTLQPTGDSNVGIGTFSPTAKLQVTGGDVYVNTIGNGVIIRSPNGGCFRITVSDAGALISTAVGCP